MCQCCWIQMFLLLFTLFTFSCVKFVLVLGICCCSYMQIAFLFLDFHGIDEGMNAPSPYHQHSQVMVPYSYTVWINMFIFMLMRWYILVAPPHTLRMGKTFAADTEPILHNSAERDFKHLKVCNSFSWFSSSLRRVEVTVSCFKKR